MGGGRDVITVDAGSDLSSDLKVHRILKLKEISAE